MSTSAHTKGTMLENKQQKTANCILPFGDCEYFNSPFSFRAVQTQPRSVQFETLHLWLMFLLSSGFAYFIHSVSFFFFPFCRNMSFANVAPSRMLKRALDSFISFCVDVFRAPELLCISLDSPPDPLTSTSLTRPPPTSPPGSSSVWL